LANREMYVCGLAWPPRRRARDATRPRAPDAATDSRAVTRSRVGGFGWRRVAVRIAVEASRGLVRIAEVDAREGKARFRSERVAAPPNIDRSGVWDKQNDPRNCSMSFTFRDGPGG